MFKVATKQMRKDKMDVEGTNFIDSDTGAIKVNGMRFVGDGGSTLKCFLMGRVIGSLK